MVKLGDIEVPRLGGIANAKKLKAAARELYYRCPGICLKCGSVIHMLESERRSDVRRKKFCNRSCAAQFNNSATPKRQRTVRKKCAGCDKDIRSKSLLCRKCSGLRALKSRPRTKEELFATRSGWQSARTEIRRHAALVYIRTGKPMACRQCGYSKHVEICHLNAVSKFPGMATIDEINDPSNLEALCPNCHWEFDNGLLELVTGVEIESTTRVSL